MDKKNIKNIEELKIAKSNFYSSNGEFGKLKSKIKNAPIKEKAALGKKLTKLKNDAELFFVQKAKEIKQNEINKKLENEWIDVTLSEKNNSIGSIHPLQLIINRLSSWFNAHNYEFVTGSEITTDDENFTMLNILKDHPARDMQDSLYINKNNLLRTHNTGLSIKALTSSKNKKGAYYSIGSVYRNDEDDATHSHQFTQLDFILIDDSVSFPNLIWTLKSLISYVLEKEIELRLRPSYFPFTEPSVEVDIKHNGSWIEVLGAGILHNNVLKNAGFNNNMNAIAAGIGIERLAMIKYEIKDIREFYLNDLRFLNQFQGGE